MSKLIDLTGKDFQNFKVLYRDTEKDKVKNDRYVYWICECKCNEHTIFSAKGADINNGKILSCGCIKKTRSNMENKILKILQKNNYNIKTEYYLPGCKYNEKGHLFFDFAIFKENKLHCLIEYNGKQHYSKVEYWGGDEGLKIRQDRDKVKYEYCKTNNIPLIIYSYLDEITEQKIISDIEEQKTTNYELQMIKIEKMNELKSQEIKGIQCALVDENNNIIEVFNSYHDASRKILNINEASNIREVCEGRKGPIYGKYIFRKLNEDGTVYIPEITYKTYKQKICGISVFDINDIVYYESVSEAARANNVERKSLSACISGNKKYSQVKLRIWRKFENGEIIPNEIDIMEIICTYRKKYVFYNGEWKKVSDVAKEKGLKLPTVQARIRNGKNLYEALEIEKEG